MKFGDVIAVTKDSDMSCKWNYGGAFEVKQEIRIILSFALAFAITTLAMMAWVGFETLFM